MDALRSVKLWKFVGGVAVAAVALLMFARGGGTDAEQLPEDSYEIKAASVETLEELVTGSFTIEHSSYELTDAVVHTSGVATSISVIEDDQPGPLEHLMDINGEPVYALVGRCPFYREIRSNTPEGDDIRTLEENLVAAGYDVGDVDGKADGDLSAALKEWQEDEELDKTGVFDPAYFIWIPDGYEVEEVLVAVGDVVAAQIPAIHLSHRGALVATVQVEQNAVASVRNGLTAVLTLDGLPDIELSGSVTKINEQPIADTSDYLVEVSIEAIHDDVRVGMTGDAEILVARHRDVVVVATGAVAGPVGAPSVRVLEDGQVVVRAIRVGLVTPAETEVVSGIGAGELVIISEKGS